MNQRVLVALEVAQQLADVALEPTDAGYLTQRVALRPAAKRREFTPASWPAPMPQAPLGPLQAANRFIGAVRLGGACAESASGLQRVFKTHREVPPVQHDCGVGQRRTLQPPQPGIAV